MPQFVQIMRFRTADFDALQKLNEQSRSLLYFRRHLRK